MRTVAQALRDEILYPIGEGFIANRIIARGLDGGAEVTSELLNCNQFRGTVADCLFALVESPNFSESDISVSLADRNSILRKANSIYASIGEEEKTLDQPKVRVGW